MNKTILACLLVLAVGAQVATAAKWKAEALPINELPPLAGPHPKATLKFTETKGVITGLLEIKSVQNLTMAHLHIGDAKTNGPPVFWVWPLDSNAPSKQPLSGSFSFAWNVNSSNIITGNKYTDFLKNLATQKIYFNIHTTASPAGAARAQVLLEKK